MEKSMKAQSIEQAKIIGKSQIEQDIEIKVIKKDIETIRDNHLVHLQQDIRRVENKVDKIDNRIWWILGVLVSTQVASMIANML
tara:strand:- start:829 stop:1080 length:252 start_codon:yes stop_codon:yes gene_type:complete